MPNLLIRIHPDGQILYILRYEYSFDIHYLVMLQNLTKPSKIANHQVAVEVLVHDGAQRLPVGPTNLRDADIVM